MSKTKTGAKNAKELQERLEAREAEVVALRADLVHARRRLREMRDKYEELNRDFFGYGHGCFEPRIAYLDIAAMPELGVTLPSFLLNATRLLGAPGTRFDGEVFTRLRLVTPPARVLWPEVRNFMLRSIARLLDMAVGEEGGDGGR